MSRNSQDALKEEILKLKNQLLAERNKRGGQVLRAEWNRAFAEEEFWDKSMQFCPQYCTSFLTGCIVSSTAAATKEEQLRSGTSTSSVVLRE